MWWVATAARAARSRCKPSRQSQRFGRCGTFARSSIRLSLPIMPELAVADRHAACVPQGCTRVSSQLIEPLLGTAPHAAAWLLLVHPGPWSAEAPGTLLNPVVAGELSRQCAEHHIRMVAVRRSGPQIPTHQL